MSTYYKKTKNRIFITKQELIMHRKREYLLHLIVQVWNHSELTEILALSDTLRHVRERIYHRTAQK